ncbi:hypothetical protein CHU98_g11487 [Xylaria longipes]|nr:hypothetical protein CHU98_g11487 [Xylaria longipes]
MPLRLIRLSGTTVTWLYLCWAAGNDGVGYLDQRELKILGEAYGKNYITVGATENDRPEPRYLRFTSHNGFPNNFPIEGNSTHEARNPRLVAAFNSRGSRVHGRVKPDNVAKPDIVAPGTYILYTKSCRINNRDYLNRAHPNNPKRWFYISGTSQATTLVGGCTAALREVLQSQGAQTSSAALIKALLVNSAEVLTGRIKKYVPSLELWFGRVNRLPRSELRKEALTRGRGSIKVR